MVYIKPDKKDIEKAIKHQIYYYQNQQKLIDAHKTRSELASLRRSFLKFQKTKNYQSEYGRIRAALDSSTLAQNGRPSPEYIQNRIKKLSALGAQAVNTIQD